MMLDAHDLADGHLLSADICIVGAGAAGITLALELANTGIDVVVLESGGLHAEKPTQALYEGSVADEQMHSLPHHYRQRRYGGSTTIWGGRCMPFDAIDFEQRDYIPHSGWPFGIEALLPFYPKANRLCEAGDFNYTIETAFDTPRRPVIDGFRSTHFTTNTLERFSCPTDFGRRYAHKLSTAPNLRIVLHANATRLKTGADGRTIEKLQARTLDGKTLNVRAERYVLASGGLETTRLLLANREVHTAGIGNEHDVLGRYYMCHIAGTAGTLSVDGPRGAVWHGYDVSDEGIYCRRRFALTADSQRRLGIGNFVTRLHHPRITDPAHRTGILSLLYLAKMFIPYEYGKRLHGEERADLTTWLQHVRNVVTDPVYTVSFLWHWLRDRTLAERKFPSIIIKPRANRFSLDFHAEQLPNPLSRVTLSDKLDALGMPQLSIDWRYLPGDVDTVQKSIALLADDIHASGVGRLNYDPSTLEFEMTRYGAYGGHHIGTVRMGSDPRSSMVNADCRLHAVENLYVSSSAVFPTSSQANPTLTIVAMTLRLGEHLKSLHRRPLPSLSTSPAVAATDSALP